MPNLTLKWRNKEYGLESNIIVTRNDVVQALIYNDSGIPKFKIYSVKNGFIYTNEEFNVRVNVLKNNIRKALIELGAKFNKDYWYT